jgi:hypothetical protein
VEFPSHNNSILVGLWNSRQFDQKFVFGCLSEFGNRASLAEAPAVTESNIRSFKNYGTGLNELDIIVAAIVGTNIQESRRILRRVRGLIWMPTSMMFGAVVKPPIDTSPGRA